MVKWVQSYLDGLWRYLRVSSVVVRVCRPLVLLRVGHDEGEQQGAEEEKGVADAGGGHKIVAVMYSFLV